MDDPQFNNKLANLLFKEEYRAIRSWPTTQGRSPKPAVPEQINNFMRTYVAKHVRNKMREKTFWHA